MNGYLWVVLVVAILGLFRKNQSDFAYSLGAIVVIIVISIYNTFFKVG